MIHFRYQGVVFRLRNSGHVKTWITTVLKREKKKAGEIQVIFCKDTFLLDMNREYLNHDDYTDIITFDYTTSDRHTVSGELYISIDRVRENALGLNIPLRDEVHRVIIHGILHCCGFRDKSKREADQIRKRENFSLSLRTWL